MDAERVEWSLTFFLLLMLTLLVTAGCALNSRIASGLFGALFLIVGWIGYIDIFVIVLGLVWIYSFAARGHYARLAGATLLVGLCGIYDNESRQLLLEYEVLGVWGFILIIVVMVPLRLKHERQSTATRVAEATRLSVKRRLQRTLHDQVARELVYAIHDIRAHSVRNTHESAHMALKHCEVALLGIKKLLVESDISDIWHAKQSNKVCSETFWRAVRRLETRITMNACWDGAEILDDDPRVNHLFCEVVEETLFNAFKYADPAQEVWAEVRSGGAKEWVFEMRNRVSGMPLMDEELRSRRGLIALRKDCVDVGLDLNWCVSDGWWRVQLKPQHS